MALQKQKRRNINQLKKEQKMYIQHKQYLSLLDQIEYLKHQNSLLLQENTLLSQQLLKSRQVNQQLNLSHQKNMKTIEELHAQAIAFQQNNKKQIMDKITDSEQKTKQLLENKFGSLENSSMSQVKDLQFQSAKAKADFYELKEFVDKIKLMHKETLGADNLKNKKQATLMDLLKWIKGMPGVAIALTKSTGFNLTMSSSNLKKQPARKSKFKENRSIINQSQSHLSKSLIK